MSFGLALGSATGGFLLRALLIFPWSGDELVDPVITTSPGHSFLPRALAPTSAAVSTAAPPPQPEARLALELHQDLGRVLPIVVGIDKRWLIGLLLLVATAVLFVGYGIGWYSASGLGCASPRRLRSKVVPGSAVARYEDRGTVRGRSERRS